MRKTVRSLNLSQVIIASCILLVLPFFLLSVWLSQALSNSYRNSIRDLVELNCQEMRLAAETYLNNVKGATYAVYSSVGYRDPLVSVYTDPAQQVSALKEMTTRMTTFSVLDGVAGIYLYGVTGNYYFINNNPTFVDVSKTLLTDDYMKQLMESDTEVQYLGLHQPFQLVNGRPVISIVRRLEHSLSTKTAGIMIVDIFPDAILSSFSQQGKTFVLLDETGETIFSTLDKGSGDLTQLIDPEQLREGNGSYLKKSADSEYIVAHETIRQNGWQIVYISSLSTEMGANRGFLLAVILLIVCLLLLTTATAILIARLISRPIRRLNDTITQVRDGNLMVRCEQQGPQEVYELGGQINDMASHLQTLLEDAVTQEGLKRQAEFDALQAQINPHFLYNTLELISAMAYVRKAPEISEACIHLGSTFRYVTQRDQSQITIAMELRHVDSYLKIMQLRFGDRFHIKVEVPDEALGRLIYKLTLQPLVENCFVHGFNQNPDGGEICLQIRTNQNGVYIEIHDNGCGIPQKKLEQLLSMIYHLETDEKAQDYDHSHVGLYNIHSRYRLAYGAGYGIISIQCPEEGGTHIILRIPG